MKFVQTHSSRQEGEMMEIMREVVSEVESPVMLYSIGKDSTVMQYLEKKAFDTCKIYNFQQFHNQ